jgi:hypothetical protein
MYDWSRHGTIDMVVNRITGSILARVDNQIGNQTIGVALPLVHNRTLEPDQLLDIQPDLDWRLSSGCRPRFEFRLLSIFGAQRSAAVPHQTSIRTQRLIL